MSETAPKETIIEGGQDMTIQVVFEVRQPRKKPLKNVGNIEFDENGQYAWVGSKQDYVYVSGLLEQHAVYPVGDKRLSERKEKANEPVQGAAAGGNRQPKAGAGGKPDASSGGKSVDGKGPAKADGPKPGDGTAPANGAGEGTVSQDVKPPEGGAETTAGTETAASTTPPVEGGPGADQTGAEEDDDPFAGI